MIKKVDKNGDGKIRKGAIQIDITEELQFPKFRFLL